MKIYFIVLSLGSLYVHPLFISLILLPSFSQKRLATVETYAQHKSLTCIFPHTVRHKQMFVQHHFLLLWLSVQMSSATTIELPLSLSAHFNIIQAHEYRRWCRMGFFFFSSKPRVHSFWVIHEFPVKWCLKHPQFVLINWERKKETQKRCAKTQVLKDKQSSLSVGEKTQRRFSHKPSSAGFHTGNRNNKLTICKPAQNQIVLDSCK